MNEDDFYREEHRIIYRGILRLYSKRIPPNILSLVEELRQTGELKKVDVQLIISLGEIIYTTAYAESHAQKIKEKAILRRLVDAGEEITADAYNDNKPVEEILDNAERKIFSITSRGDNTDFESLGPIIQRSFEKIQHIYNNKGGFTGVETGYIELDKITSGLQPSDLILIAARPSMGKTAFALNMAMRVAMHDKVVAIFSLEMSKEQLGHRLLSCYSAVNSLALNTGNISGDELNDLTDTLNRLADKKMYIDDTAGISVMEMRSKIRRLKTEVGLDLVVIDYLQLMQGRVTKSVEQNRQQEISETRELKVPIVSLSQLSRSVELRAEKKPQLSDLRESGSLEQDADIVMFLYREEYYNKETDNANLAELIVAKNRNGPTGSITLRFNKECMRFENFVKGDF